MAAWWERAACRGASLKIFFPDRAAHAERARRYCAACPVVADCRADAASRKDAFGVWGGECWSDGSPQPWGPATRPAYTPEFRAEAVVRFRQLRPLHATDREAYRAVAQLLEVRNTDTIRKWIAAAIPAEERPAAPGRAHAAEMRAAALATFDRLLPEAASRRDAVRRAAAEHGLNLWTVAEWVRQSRAREPEGAAA